VSETYWWELGDDPATQAAMEQEGARIQDLVGDLVTLEVRDHLRYPHDCVENCFNGDVADALLDKMPEPLVRALALHAVRGLARAYLFDHPEEIIGEDA